MKLIYSTQPVRISYEQMCAQLTYGCNLLKLFTSKMWMFYLTITLLSVIQVHHGTVAATDCSILSVTSPSASTLNVEWASYSGASSYLLDFKVVNTTTIAPVVVLQSHPTTQRLVHGLRPGHDYEITLKVLTTLYQPVCTAKFYAKTVPAKSQITFAQSISSTSIKFEWSSVTGADNYTLYIEEFLSSPLVTFQQTFTTLSGQIDSLSPSTTYSCRVYSSNSAGRSINSAQKTITTLVQPPSTANIESTGRTTARVTWTSVSGVLQYQVTVTDNDNPDNDPVHYTTPGLEVEIDNLEPCSNYTVGVSSANVFLVPGEPKNIAYTTATINPVTTITVDYSCAAGMVTVTWDTVFGANTYRATAVDGTGAVLNCTSSSTSCQIIMLKCGEKYDVHVTAISDDCESTSTTSQRFDTVPCAPANPSAIHSCDSNVIVFSWETTNNTNFYVAHATDKNGQVTECRTLDNTCYFTDASCGQYYTYKVYAVSSECDSAVSEPQFIRTAPCLPTNVRTGSECNSETLLTTWDAAEGALSYKVEVVGNTLDQYNCTSNTNSCSVEGVPCGEHFSVWITGSNDNCSTPRVLGTIAQAVPCPPTSVSAAVACSPDSARINWTTSVGSVFYIAIAQDTDGNSFNCNSMSTNCLLEQLPCGKNYTGSVIGTNIKCNSSASQEISFRTAPCPPASINAYRDCDANHATIVWQNNQLTGLYTATIVDQAGAQLNCTSNTENYCEIQSLPCGKRYNVTVSYNDGYCSSSSTPTSLDSVPCGPEDVTAAASCDNGELTVTWTIPAPTPNYTTTISGGTGPSLQCNSTDTQCTLGGLPCGTTYSVIVSAVSGSCSSMPSSEITVKSLPCPPTDVAVTHTCSPNPVPVSWTAGSGATYYKAVAVTGAHEAECTTNETSCSFSSLQCGQVYNVSVSGGVDDCLVQQTSTVMYYTEPCVPTDVVSVVDCTDKTAHVSWSPSPNAINYSVEASSSGLNLSCSSTGSNSCTLENLVCGQTYEVVVTATDGTCETNASVPFTQDPVPCAPMNVATSHSCANNDIVVSWDTAAMPLNYSVSATLLTGSASPVQCSSDGSSCTLTGLQCGQMYNVTVKASSGSCCGPYSVPQTVTTAPCSPQGLTAVTECGTNSLQVSWDTSLGATSYTATVTDPDGVAMNCSSSNPTCPFSGLQCATQYHISVTSEDDSCSSSPSQTMITTGPCDPVNVTTVLQCGSDTATVSWEASAGAVTYTVHASEQGSMYETSCTTNTLSCGLTPLNCGKMYTVYVLAQNDTCNSTGSMTTTLQTAPCSPSVQNSALVCGTDSSVLSWTPVTHATGYTVSATTQSGDTASCNSTSTTCTLNNLLCSKTYMATVTAQGDQCDSAPGPNFNITTAPCPPAITSTQYICSNSSVALSWTAPAGSVGFLVQVVGEGHTDSCHSVSTYCMMHNIPCGLELNLTVQAVGSECNSTLTVSETLESVPCAPEDVDVILVCSNHSALVTWSGSPSAEGYNVTFRSYEDGHMHHCHTTTTSCALDDIHCGEVYAVTVTPCSETCKGIPSAIYNFTAGLCPPASVSVSTDCENNTVSWSAVEGAEMFTATATADDGHSHTCQSNSSTSCNFTDLHCGETYSVTVVTVDGLWGCSSRPSSAEQLITAQCPPTNLAGDITCETNMLTLTWDQISEPGISYVIKVEKIGSTAAPSEYSTSNNSHTLSNLECGERYAFRIAAHNGNCLSQYSPVYEMSTAPCQPTDFHVRVDCGTNNGNFSWTESSGASFYTVEVTGEHGHVASCSSNDTSCAVKLHCGRTYTASLVASTESCNSTKHADIQFESAPCLPENVVAEVDCSTNVMSVSWSELPVSDDYTAWAISEGHNVSCNSTSNSCSIHDLQCGHVYDVVVTASTIHCDVIAGSDYKVQSVPCAPDNTSVDQNCSTNAITVQWDHGHSGQRYTVSASTASGVNTSCDTTDSSCSFLDLSCGQHYTFTVTGHTNVCMSESTTMQTYTAPCPPSSVSAELDCATHDGVVSWSPAATGVAYSVQAVTVDGHNDSCSSMGMSCTLQELVCGQEYAVVVEAMHTGCSGPLSSPVMLLTEPCVPMNLSVTYNMGDATVQWDPASNDSSYSVQAVTDQGPAVSCNSTTTSCPLTGLECSKTYNITVTAHNSACSQGVTSEAYQLITEPCPPTNVQATMSCEQYSATVYWDPSVNAVNYAAYVANQNGHNTSCDTTSTSCVVEALMCGTEYNIWVQAFGVQYHSDNTTAITFSPGPCPPTSIEGIVDCETDTAMVSWQPSVDAGSYTVELTALSGHTASCTTTNTNCESEQLQCGQQYNVTVTAHQPLSCNATALMSGYLTTEPCAPMSLSVQYNVSHARVTWDAANGATSYFVQAVTDQGLGVSCNSTNTHCYLNGLQCSQTYNVTVMSHSSACNHSEPSEMYLLKTEPCPPTNVLANVQCEQLTVTVSWEQSDNAIGYVAYINNQNGHSASCVAADAETFCDVSGLVCGTEYNAWVKAIGDPYNSSASEMISFISAPCLPTAIDVEVDCAFDGAALISWGVTEGTANFSLTAIVSGSLQTLCTTQQNNCSVNGLNCGETYNLSLTASNTQCSLTAPMHANLTTRPCPPEHVNVDLNCGSRTAVLSWEQRSDVELYKASAVKQSGGEVIRINSTSSTAEFPNLDCGQTYNFTVEAHSQGCCSRSSDTVFIQTEPCQPMMISAQAPCQSETVNITWQQASGVETYLITATGNLNYEENFNTTQTGLSAELPCGQNYTVIIKGRGNQCDSIPSSPVSFKTTPCIPQDVVVYPQCEVNTGSVRWGASDGAKTYIVTATGRDGHDHVHVTNSTSHTWDDLHCGECYNVTVKAQDDDCISPPSSGSVIHMASCVPQNLVTYVDCDDRLISLSWNATEYTEEYIITVETSDSTHEATTNSTVVSFSDLACGQNYNLTVTPENQHCPHSATATTSIQTWPCPLTGVSAMLDCLSGSTTVTWQSSGGTDSYKATLQTDTGISKMCTSESTTCSVSDLACGYNFSVSVTASNQQCNVTSDEATSVQSAPCVPTGVSVVMDCANNSAAVSWSASRGAAQYKVIAHSSHSNVTCQTSDLSCDLSNLTCGHSYTVQVVAMDDTCSSTPSQAVELNSAPCPPENVTAQFSCSSNDMTVSWDPTGEADHYLVSVTPDNGGSPMPCNTTNTECTFNNVECGKTFTVHVTSVKGSCSSQHCTPVHIVSAPCQPQAVEGRIDCVTNSALISWEAANGADSYTVLAVGEGAHMANCTTSTNNTCEVEDLECGILYNFTVTATNSQCDSQPSAIIELETAPCTLPRITASPQCHNASILVVWDLMDAGSADVLYTATAEGSDHTFLSCNSTGTSCYLHEAQCGLRYTVIVAANSDVCTGLRSPPHRISMEPCQPTGLMVSYSCDDHTTLASWNPSSVADTYHVVAVGTDGHNHTCDTSFSNCSLSQLHCDVQYSIFVISSHENCSSLPSQTFSLLTGPCQPEGLSVEYQCNNQSAMLSWNPSDNAVDYYGCAQDGNGNMLYCHSTTAVCTIQGLDCGTVYNFSVQASDGSCNSSFSDPEESGAVPCPPDGVEVTLLPLEEDVRIVHVTWTESSCDNTEYMLMLTGNLLGDNQAQFELSSYWTSMTFFEFPLPCGSFYEATVESRNNAGTSGPSVPLNGTTVPCPPLAVTYSGNSSFTRISWDSVVFATSYTVYDNSSSPRAQLCTTSQPTCSVHQGTTSDNVVVTASNAVGESTATAVTNVVELARRRRDVSEQENGAEGLSAPILDVKPQGAVLEVEWSEVNGASFYNLVAKKQDSVTEPEALIVYGERMILTDDYLQPNIYYCITVSASASETSDPGPESSPVCAKITQ